MQTYTTVLTRLERGWSGVSGMSDYATLTGARAVNDPHGTNVAQIVLAGMKRSSPAGITEMPGFGAAYSDADIAAVVVNDLVSR